MKGKSFKEIMINIVVPVLFFILTILSVALPKIFNDTRNISRQELEVERDGVTFVGYDITALQEINAFEYVNHYPGEYVAPKDMTKQGKKERVDDLTIAPFGTIKLVIYNYDKSKLQKSQEINSIFDDTSKTNNIVLLYLPFASDSANVWIDDNCYATYGKMQDYKVDGNIVNCEDMHHKGVQPIKMHCILTSEYDKISDDRLDASCVITVHYQAKRGLNCKNSMPIVGTTDDVERVVNFKFVSTASFIAIMVALFVAFFCFVLINFNIKHIPLLGITFSALLLLVAQIVSLKYSTIIGKEVSIVSMALLLVSAGLSLRPPIKSKTIVNCWHILNVATFVNFIVSAIISVSVSFMATKIYLQVVYLSLILIEFVFLLVKLNNISSVEFIAIFIALLTPIISLFANYSMLSMLHPACFTLCISGLIVLWHIYNETMVLNKRNELLTRNLKAEVATQTNNLQTALDDREMLLSFMSHDLRKSSMTIELLANNILANGNEKDVALANQIKDKNAVLLTALGNINKFIKWNFTNEPFAVKNIKELFDTLDKSLTPDCEANGIKITFKSAKLAVRCKYTAIISVISNLIFNAIEHSGCQNIVVEAKKNKDRVDIMVHDDGKGIDNPNNIFMPYATGSNSNNNMGLGLFLVKSEVEAQGGVIKYLNDNGSTFVVSLLREFV